MIRRSAAFGAQWSQIRALLWEWDPIGVSEHADAPGDEYDCLAGPLLSLLQRDAGSGEIEELLRRELEEHFGLDPESCDPGAFAERLRGWFQARP